MKLDEKLRRSILRSQKAYELYIDKKFYFQALRILKANEIIYQLLQEYIFECKQSHLDHVFTYIHHLEDWFVSFKALEKTEPELKDLFIFERLEGSPFFPVRFIENVLSE